MNADEAVLRRDLAVACRILAANGHGDTIFGHVAGRLEGWERFWMKPAGVGLEEVGPDDLILVDLDGRVLEGKGKRHEEFPIHAEIMRARPDVLSVVHTHPKFSIAFAATGLALRPISHEGTYFWPPEVPVFDEFTDLVRSRAQGERVTKALGAAAALFLRNHGIAVPGPDVAGATVAALFLERACEIQLTAGPDARHTPEQEAVTKRRMWFPERIRAVFEYYARRLTR